MSVKPKKPMRPRDAKTLKQVCDLRTDNFDVKGGWVLLDGNGKYSITIARQVEGHAVTQQINIPRREFNQIVDWYMREQKP